MKSLANDIQTLQDEYTRLKKLDNIFEKMIKIEFNHNKKEIHKLLKCHSLKDDFAKKIIAYFDLKTNDDMNRFIDVMCQEGSLNYFNNKRNMQ